MKQLISALPVFALSLLVSHACVAGTPQKLVKQLETISKSIGNHTDIHAVSESLYRQVRPNVQINNKTLSRREIDKKVRTYIMKKYAPILVMNYSLQYSKMKQAGLHFGGCRSLQALPFDDNTEMALCTNKALKTLDVRYMTRKGKANWQTTSVYEFSKREHQLMLTAIQLNVKKGQKFRISGI